MTGPIGSLGGPLPTPQQSERKIPVQFLTLAAKSDNRQGPRTLEHCATQVSQRMVAPLDGGSIPMRASLYLVGLQRPRS